AVHGIVSFPAGVLVTIVELPTWFGPALRPRVRFVSAVIARPPQLQAAMSTNMALSVVEVRPVKLIPPDALAVVNVALDCIGKSTPVNVRAQALSNTNVPPLVYVMTTFAVVAVGFFSDQISAPMVLPSVPADLVRFWEPLNTTLEIVLPTAR